MKCNIMQLTRKRIKKVNAVCSLEGTFLENVDNIKYLVVTVSKDLKCKQCLHKNKQNSWFLRTKGIQGVGATNPEVCLPCLGPTWNSSLGRIGKGSESCS